MNIDRLDANSIDVELVLRVDPGDDLRVNGTVDDGLLMMLMISDKLNFFTPHCSLKVK